MAVTTFGQRFKSLLVWVNRLSGWLLLLAVGWLCWTLARLLWLLLAPPQAPMLPTMDIQPSSSVPTDYSSAFMVFEQPKPEMPQPKPPPNVSLKGVMVATPSQNSSAILDVNGKVQTYRIDETLDDSDYKLVAVEWNEVVLADSNDQQVVITLLEPMELNQNSITANNGSGQVSNQRLPSTDEGYDEPFAHDVMGNAQDDMSSPGGDVEEAQYALEEAINELKQNPASYLSRMGVMATGDGYQVTQAMPAQIKDRLGLEPGDRVLSVNGQNVGSNPGQDATLLQQIQQTGEAQIEVQRGEQVITIRQQF